MVTTATPDEPVKLRLRESWVSRRGPEVGARGASERDAPGDEGAPFVAGAYPSVWGVRCEYRALDR